MQGSHILQIYSTDDYACYAYYSVPKLVPKALHTATHSVMHTRVFS